MRLLNTQTEQFVDKDPRKEKFKYAILSHTWDSSGEQTYQELKKIQEEYAHEDLDPEDLSVVSALWNDPKLSPKIRDACEIARQNHYLLIWIDSCCIDKTSSSELSEAINSMFAWYRGARVCYAYLADVSSYKDFSEEGDHSEDDDDDDDDDDEYEGQYEYEYEYGSEYSPNYSWDEDEDSQVVVVDSEDEVEDEDSEDEDEDQDQAEDEGSGSDGKSVKEHRDSRDHLSIRQSRWFKRGWTLQELLAPRNLIFLSKDWSPLGSKKKFAGLVNSITGISAEALSGRQSLSKFSVAQRLSWAAGRETTRVEDRAYSLLGIFDINIPTLYGEGDRAFQRLQEEILQRIPDQSIFAWGRVHFNLQILRFDHSRDASESGSIGFTGHNDPRRSLPGALVNLRGVDWPDASFLSLSPDKFADGHAIEAVPLAQLFHHYPGLPVPDYNPTPHGHGTYMPLIPLSAFWPDAFNDDTVPEWSKPSEWYLVILGCQHMDKLGHLIGRVCHINSATPGIHIVSRGVICLAKPWASRSPSPDLFGFGWGGSRTELVTLSPEVLKDLSMLATVSQLVYLSHPKQRTLLPRDDQSRRYRPHKTIILLLKNKANTRPHPHNGISSESNASVHSAHTATTLDLQWPDQDHPDTHSLTISQSASHSAAIDVQDDMTAIQIQYKHALRGNGREFTMTAHVTGLLYGHPIIPVAPVSWHHSVPWVIWQQSNGMKTIKLRNGAGITAKLEVSLEYLAPNHYLIDAQLHPAT